MKIIKGILIGIAVELFFIIGTVSTELESFFLLFALLFAVLFIYNLFSNGSADLIRGVGGKRGTSGNTFNSKVAEDLYGTEKFTTRIGGGVLDSTNIVLFIFTVFNIIGYIVVMPK